jgi:tricorn protease
MIGNFFKRATIVAAGSCALLLQTPASLAQDTKPHAGMMRYPDVSASHIVFSYAGDLWLVPREGGSATPLASPPGEENFARFSPDGRSIAFVGNYDGNRDIYTLPLTGGVPTRVTYHPGGEWLQDWTADGKLLFSMAGLAGLGRQQELYTVSPSGGLPTKLPVPYGATASISPDGTWLAYTPHSIDNRTWKRYRGGMQTDIWLFNLKTNESKKITDWEGTDSLPMFQKDAVYYLSDQGPEHRGNIWKYDIKSGQRSQVTKFKDYDLKWPSMGPGPAGDGEIVFTVGPEMHLLDLKSGQSKVVEVTVPGARPKIRPSRIDGGDQIRGADLSPTGKRVVVEGHGDLFTLPAKEGSPRVLTRTNGIHEQSPAWSPDGKTIAYFSDETGEYELYLRPADGSGEAKALTKGSKTYYYNPTWSPDSKQIAFSDKGGNLYLATVESGQVKKFDVEPWANQPGLSWSGDSQWIAYAMGLPTATQNAIYLYNAKEDKKHQVTSGRFNDTSPTFDRKGEFLYYASQRDFSAPIYEDLGTTFAYADMSVLLAVPLRKDVKSPLLPKNDEEGKDDEKKDEKKDGDKSADSKPSADKHDADKKDADKKDDDKKDEKKKEEPPKPVAIDVDGFERRAVPLPVKRGTFGGLTVNNDGNLIYLRMPHRGSDEKTSIKIIDLTADEKEEKNVVSDVIGVGISANGKKLLVFQSGAMSVVDAKADQKTDKKVPKDGLDLEIDPRTEWKQILREAWRLQRDFFYDPNMHGVDWEAVYKQYEAMLPDCVSRADVSFLIREMISELNVGHAYYFGGDDDPAPNVSVGMLGCDFALENGAYRITRIYEGGSWDSDARGPLSQPGVDVKQGDYLLAVNGAPLDPKKAPWAAFVDLAGKAVTLTVSDNPTRDEKARDVLVKTLDGEGGLRYRAWIERNRKYVDDKSGGKVGYIYVPNTGVDGQNDLFRQFFGQMDKDALIIDERWNGGGQIPTRFIELLNRPVTNYWARRDGNDWTWPPDSQQGPKCMLINGLAGSGGDMFPWLFRYNKLGKLIGMRTWGGLVGISGNPGLIDGAGLSAPTFAFYEKDGTWGVEGHGVDPDIEVIDDPSKMISKDGSVADPQLDTAINLMLKEIGENGYKRPKRPAYPDRKGMGIRPEDK